MMSIRIDEYIKTNPLPEWEITYLTEHEMIIQKQEQDLRSHIKLEMQLKVQYDNQKSKTEEVRHRMNLMEEKLESQIFKLNEEVKSLQK